MAVGVAVGPSPLLRAVRAAADVVEVDDDDDGGFLASVLFAPGGGPAVARLCRSLRGSSHEGAVLRSVMEHTTGAFGRRFFIWSLSPTGVVVR